MKKILALSAAAVFAVAVMGGKAFAADRGHARAGIVAGFTSSSSNAKNVTTSSIGCYHFGLSAQLPIALGFAIQPSVLYQTKGTKLDEADWDNFSLDTKASYLEVPVQIQWGPDILAFRPYAFAEPFVGYGLHVKTKGASEKSTSFSEANLARWEYGLGLGVGIDIWKIQVTAKYFWNFGSLYDSESGKVNKIGDTVKQAFKDGRNFNGVTFSLAYMF